LETSSIVNGKIGTSVIKGSRENLEELKKNLKNQIQKLQNNFPDPQ
jgi:hypothetical protein